MTLIYARIANRVVADEYAAVSAQIDALYGQPPELPADYESSGMARLRRETQARRRIGVVGHPPGGSERRAHMFRFCIYSSRGRDRERACHLVGAGRERPLR